jgi:uncharacterized membrane protein
LLGIIPNVGAVLSIVGFILILVAVKYISDSIGDKSIFNNMIIAVVTAVGGIVAGVVLVFASVFRFVGLAGFGEDFWSREFWSQGFPSPSEIPPGDIIGLIGSVIIGLVVIWIFLIIIPEKQLQLDQDKA